MPFKLEWCCQHSEIWDTEEEGPPCEICPIYEKEIDPYNNFCLERWKYLDVTGRDRGFGENPLREEAIDLHLSRYNANDPDFYETIFQIEITLFSHKQKEEKKRQDREKKKNSSATPSGPQKNYSRPVQRKTSKIGKKKRR